MKTLADAQKAYLSHIDIAYSYQLAKQMERFRTNPVLGYRTAGSQAEYETGEMLLAEMQRIGLSDVHKDAFTLDTWDFHHARLRFGGSTFELGGYQTQFDTHGPQTFRLVDAGKGTSAELEGLDVRGKLVLVDINQRDDWWISYPVYQAHLHGAAAVIAVQNNGYGEIHPAALNAQNICSVADAPAFSLSRQDAAVLRRQLAADSGETTVTFDAQSTVGFDGTSYNIVGSIPGRDPDAMILFSAHYDSYFSGFQDDNCAVSMMLGISKALLESGYQPEKTLLFCAMAAEEWGVSNSKYDWSTGAYNQIFRVHPDWAGKIIADINFELPAYPHDTQDIIRCVYEYQTFLKAFAKTLPPAAHIYPAGIGVASPIQTWSDDFSLSIAGVPSMVNDFAGGSFMKTHYHSQFDTEDSYEEEIYRFHHELYGSLALAFDRCAVAPLDFSCRLRALQESLSPSLRPLCEETGLSRQIHSALTLAELAYAKALEWNHAYARALEREETDVAARLSQRSAAFHQRLLEAFKFCEDAFVRLTWHDDVIFPHEYAQKNLTLLDGALEALDKGNASDVLDHWLHQIDTNWYAYYFDEATCRHFVDYVLHQPDERLMWGAGRIVGQCGLFPVVRSLQQKRGLPGADFAEETAALQKARAQMSRCLKDSLSDEARACAKLAEILEQALKS